MLLLDRDIARIRRRFQSNKGRETLALPIPLIGLPYCHLRPGRDQELVSRRTESDLLLSWLIGRFEQMLDVLEQDRDFIVMLSNHSR